MTAFKLCRFETALHPDVKRGEAGVAWIKSYTGQLDDPDYLLLGTTERGLLGDLRLLAARRKNKLPLELKRLAAMLRGDKSPSRLAPMLDKLAELRFIEREDGAEWVTLHTPKPRKAKAEPTQPATESTQLSAVSRKAETDSDVENESGSGVPVSERLHDASPEKRRSEQTVRSDVAQDAEEDDFSEAEDELAARRQQRDEPRDLSSVMDFLRASRERRGETG